MPSGQAGYAAWHYLDSFSGTVAVFGLNRKRAAFSFDFSLMGSLMAVWFVSRHAGAISWMKKQGIKVDRWVAHLDTGEVTAGDIVIGTLPVHLAAAVCARGARFFFLELHLRAEQRGRELDEADMLSARSLIREYFVHFSPDEGSVLSLPREGW